MTRPGDICWISLHSINPQKAVVGKEENQLQYEYLSIQDEKA